MPSTYRGWFVTVVSLFALVGACTSHPAPEPSLSKDSVEAIIFSDGGDIFTMRPDGTDLRNLTANSIGSRDEQPAWSPDGRKILVRRRTLASLGWYVMDANSGEMRSLLLHISAASLRWSPDGRRIAFGDGLPIGRGAGTGGHSGFGDIYVTYPDGSGLVKLTHVTDVAQGEHGLWAAEEPAWSPDGTELVYSLARLAGGVSSSDSRQTSSFGYVIKLDGTGMRMIARNFQSPAWSPDGTRIIFSRNVGGGGFDLFVIDLATHRVTRLTRRLFPAPLSPSWSPDGTRIAFAAEDLYVMNADGTNLIRLTSDGLVSSPDWKPTSS